MVAAFCDSKEGCPYSIPKKHRHFPQAQQNKRLVCLKIEGLPENCGFPLNFLQNQPKKQTNSKQQHPISQKQNKQTNKQTTQPASKQINKQPTNQPTNQTNKQTNQRNTETQKHTNKHSQLHFSISLHSFPSLLVAGDGLSHGEQKTTTSVAGVAC